MGSLYLFDSVFGLIITMKFYQQKSSKHSSKPFAYFNSNYQSNLSRQNSSLQRKKPQYSPNSYLTFEDSSPIFKGRDSSFSPFHKTTTEPVWEHLYQEGLKAQKQHEKVYLKNQDKEDKQCTFHPKLNQTTRLLIDNSTSFLQRNGAWREHKIEKLIKQKEQTVHNELKECTFTPRIHKNINKSFIKSGGINLNKTTQFNILKSQRENKVCAKSRILKEQKENYVLDKKSILKPRKDPKHACLLKDIKEEVRKQLKKINLE